MSLNTFASFPNGLLPDSEKSKPDYGIKVLRAILGATQIQREAFKKKLFENRRYAEGNQDISQYLDELEIEGKKMYTNISYRPRPIAQNFKNVVVNGYLMREEYPTVTATSKHIKERKERKKSDAEFRMQYGEALNELSQEAGVPLVEQDEFTPESKEELDLHFSLEDKEREELLMQEIIGLALAENNIETLKASALDDQFVAQLHGYYNYIDPQGRLIIDYIQPEDAILDNSRKDDFSDTEFRGRYLRLTVSQVRARFALTPKDEYKLWTCAKGFMGMFGNPSRMCDWEIDYRNTVNRPYDSYTVELAHVWWRTSKVINYVEGKDRYNRQVFDIDDTVPDTNSRKKTGVKYPETAYEGFFTANTMMCLEWGEQKNILRDGEDKETLLCPFIYNMPYNKGRMLPNSLMNMMIDSIRNMDIAVLKIKQLVAKATPDDYMIDINSLNELDLGTGDTLQPLEVMQIHAQTGRLYYNGKNEDGTPNQPPIRANINPLDTKLNAYVSWYNTELENIRGYLGINEFRDGSATTPRISSKFMQAQNEASNTATWFLYRAYTKSTEELIRQVGIRIWDALNYGTVNKGYLKYLGKQNIDFIKSRKDITASSYDIDFKLGLTQQDKQVIDQYINTALSNGQIELGDVFMIQRIKDPRVAEQMLTYTYNKRKRERQEEAIKNSQMQAQATAEAGKAVEEAKMQSTQMQLEAEMAKEKAKGDNEQINLMLKGAMAIIEQSFTLGKEIPSAFIPLVDLALQNASSKVEVSLYQTEQEQEQIAQQEMQQQQLEELQGAVQNGEIDEEEAMILAEEMGLQ